ncbi:MAG: HAD-IB family phosphatase [Selenomonadaceae bacterium]|nr:HAD-IB family phosphatase [Selenomonadaceae bacterium]
MRKIYAFDLDGTVTTVETLPLLAAELNLSAKINLLTELTLSGRIPFEISFRMRYGILNRIPLERIVEIMATVPLDSSIEKFIGDNRNDCVLVTGNLDRWIEPIAVRLGCEIYSSTLYGERLRIIDKGAVVRRLRSQSARVISIGESFNDVSMLEAADVSIAYGGVHRPIAAAVSVADFVVFDGDTLCRLLTTL